MIEVAYEGSAIVPVLALFLAAAVISGGLWLLFKLFAYALDGWTESQQIPSHQPPQWTSSVTYEQRKPVRKYRLPYGAYGTDIRGKRERRSGVRG